MSSNHEKLSNILRTTPEALLELELKMNALTGKSGVIDRIMNENQVLVKRTLEELGCNKNQQHAENVFEALTQRLKHMDQELFEFLDKPDLSKLSGVCGKLCDTAQSLAPSKTGFFIKKEKAIQMLEKFPPQNLLDFFGYASVRELFEKQNFSSVFSALRFAQDTKWMHTFFDEAYNDLTIDDFEEREIELKVLETEWLKVAEKFLEKKYHNVSHLKELGIIFIIPIPIDTPGETMRLFTLLLHYLNEVPFYSKMFRKLASASDLPAGETGFTTSLKSLLRGDVLEEKLPETTGLNIRIVQRYLAKDDVNDFRLIEPHVNPEAEHWYKAEGDLGRLSIDGGGAMGYWQGLDFAGDFFQKLNGFEDLVSFDLIDLVMSLVKKGEIKYLYHQQEALWNKIFIEYLGREKLEQLIEENIIKGYISL